LEDERSWIDVVTQINAVRAALDKIALGWWTTTCGTA
jgi:DNA-binding FrmR family transcriptional regulator